ncbi:MULTISPECIES: RNA polymerase sigma factor [Spirosoma]|uniref:RNA polymerase sigma factor n=1 Tax=Spirosoma liriopis TaxID=2937440 RepID=A0ABT0HH74_9BACT|nr:MULTISPECIES: RNA polymerase sigma factor [Spirosoma]MCK8491509.1 RNA polymerase sigma factor [Spirosoma liriopis]UHG90875.1 RNA polymerase sigma factor [Spirosoma oryzicola]
MKQLTDEELVRLYIETQKNTYFERLYERYCDKVYRKCLSFTKDSQQAEDLTHDIFLKLVIKIGSFKEQSRFSTWLYSITYNYCTDHVRAPHRRSEIYMDEGWERLEVDNSDDGLAELAELEAQQLKKAMEHLDPTEQSLLLMKYQDDVSIRELADMHGTTESAIKMRLKRTRDKLRKYYLEGAVFWLLLAIKAALSIRWPFK